MSSKSMSALLLPLMLLMCAETGEAQRRRGMKHRPKRSIERVALPGTWGGAHIRLDINDGGATVEYDCAHGRERAARGHSRPATLNLGRHDRQQRHDPH
jgi:hypothetical protein